MTDQPRNLHPQLDAFHHELSFGLLLFIPDYNARERTYTSMAFQYNPETMTRTRQGEWTSDRVRGASKNLNEALTAQERSTLSGHRGGGLYAKSETIAFRLVFDAAELVLRGESARGNVLPELAFLEQIALGGDEAMKTQSKSRIRSQPAPNNVSTTASVKVGGNDAGGGAGGPTDRSNSKPRYRTKIQGTAPSELVLVLGPRSFPVVLTSLTITERRFNPKLEPIRAECDCKFRILETQEVKHNKPAQVAFAELFKQRGQLAAEAQLSAEDPRVEAVVSALERS